MLLAAYASRRPTVDIPDFRVLRAYVVPQIGAVMVELEAVEWDDANEAHATRHGARATEIEQVLMNDPHIRPNARGTSDYFIEGLTAGGRRIRVAVVYDEARPHGPIDRRLGASVSKPLTEMSEAERADYHYEHRDDAALWDSSGKVVRRDGRAPLPPMVSVRLSPQEAERVHRAAQRAGMALSAYLRQAVLGAEREAPWDVDRVRLDVEEAGRRIEDARRAIG